MSILPPATLGILGSGQLGRMLALEARRMGYGVRVFSPERATPTGQIADHEIVADYADLDAIRAFARGVDVVTFEFENVLSATADAAAEYALVRPSGRVLHTTQNRLREKTFLAQAGLPVTPFHPVATRADLYAGLEKLGYPAILKTADFGYDGKGQVKIERVEAVEVCWAKVQGRKGAGESGQSSTTNNQLPITNYILEAFIPFTLELSVVAARGIGRGGFAHFGAVENQHRHHILDVALAPARVSPQVAQAAVELAYTVLETLDVVGVLCVEMFLAPGERLLINEVAPRPHNSGHFTIEACVTNQFEQQLRAVCGLPLGDPTQLRPAAMANLLGEVWANGAPNWRAALAYPEVKLHLYGKAQARPGRKMGHLTALGATVEEAMEKVLAAREALSRRAEAQR
jgi:5-(carboxyamino)imidazole ribonucleotide synthase